MIFEEKLDIFTLSETRLDDTIGKSDICPAGMSIFRRDQNRRGGGVAIIISSTLHFALRPDLNTNSIESLWLEIYPRSKRSMLICSTYRPPSQNDFFQHLLAECDMGLNNRNDQHLCILGDLNCDILQPNLLQTRALKLFCEQLYMINLVDCPTLITKKRAHLVLMLFLQIALSALRIRVLNLLVEVIIMSLFLRF